MLRIHETGTDPQRTDPCFFDAEQVHRDCYTAHIEETAKCNGEPNRVTETRKLDEAMIFTGLSKYMGSTDDPCFDIFRTLALSSRKVRINGSAALDLCHVASGSCDASFGTSIYLWDHAAAGLIARQAGAILSLYPLDSEPYASTMLCANEHLIDDLRTVLKCANNRT